MKNIKRVFTYVKGRYRFLVLSIAMILLVQILNFLSPLIVKTILDDYILGIEYEWAEVETADKTTVSYSGKYFKQLRNIDEDDHILGDASIIIFENGYYFSEDKIPEGNRSLSDGILSVTVEKENENGEKETEVLTFPVVRLQSSEITSFYKPIIPMLVVLLIIMFARSVIAILASYVQSLSTSKVVTDIARDGRTAAMKSVERLPLSYFEGEPAGKTASRITQDVDGLIILYRQIVGVLSNAILSFIFAYVGMFILDYRLALLSFIAYPFFYLWVRFFLKKLKKFAEKVNELRSLMTAKINEIINGIHILQIFNFRKQTISEFNELNTSFTREQLKEVKLHLGLGWNFINIIRGLITTFIVAYFGWQHLHVAGVVISAGLIYAYNEYLLKILEPVNTIFTQVSEYQHSMVRVERISKLIEGDLEDNDFAMIDRYKGDIRFDNVWFAYVPNEYVLKGISFDVKANTMVGLVGHTGSGKSSLMNLLLRFYDLTDEKSGKITIDGIDISTLPKRTLRYHLGIVLQEPVLFKGDIASNIRFGKENVSDQEIENVLISLGGENLLRKFEKGIHQPITRAGVNMSSGEKQIIALARVLIHDPSILIMDEATSHIDTETEEMIKKALEVVCRNRTVIVIAHRLSTIYNADKIIVLDHGLKVEEGTHKELVLKNGVYANIYRAQVADSK